LIGPDKNQGEQDVGMLDDLVGNAGGIASLVKQNPQLLEAAASLLSSKPGTIGGTGGLAGLVQAFQSKGLGDIAQSWVSTGANLPVSAKQITDVLGSNTVAEFARHANLDAGAAGGALASILPALVNQFTPKGELPQTASLENALGSLAKSLLR
jgi:uncharacterized protein YidB (DUF937 family)